jgi:transcriptional regulator with XRE-family HTH domain
MLMTSTLTLDAHCFEPVSPCGVQENGGTATRPPRTPGPRVTASPGAAASPPAVRLGERIRSRRRELNLTLVEVAERAELSHPFLSQLERGLARPSMSSLFRIARALGVTQDWLLAAGSPRGVPAEPVAVLRHDEGIAVPVSVGGVARQLLAEPGRYTPTEFTDPPATFEEFFEHDGTEFVYIAQGVLDVELGAGRLFTLTAGECLRYPGSTPHRWRAGCPGSVRVLMIHSDLPSSPLPEPHGH